MSFSGSSVQRVQKRMRPSTKTLFLGDIVPFFVSTHATSEVSSVYRGFPNNLGVDWNACGALFPRLALIVLQLLRVRWFIRI